MSDRWAVVLAMATFAAALAAVDGHVGRVPLGVPLGVVALAWLLYRLGWFRPELLVLAAALAAATLAHRSLDGLAAPLATGPVTGEVTLVGDPVPDGHGGASADVRLHGRRLSARARGAAAAALDDRLSGEKLTVVATVRPPGVRERRAPYRHLAGRLEVDAVVGWRTGDPFSRAANGLRRTLASGAESLPARQRSLLAGITLGDDRAQPPDMTEAFRAAGLSHLLAVSGQNVAFALVIVTPVLSRLRFGPRLAVTLAVLVGFALLTRGEPSVLRATAMASVAAVGTALGRPASTLRALALGVAAILLIDPLLVTSLGFRLSVAGAAGIVVGAGPLSGLLPGPRWLATPLSVTLAAQAAVAPLLVAVFGPVPVAAIPANLLAVAAAGPIMVWGLTAGLAAGVVGGPMATVIHLPTRLLLGWVDGVARAAAGWPLGALSARHLVVLGALATAVAVVRTRARRLDALLAPLPRSMAPNRRRRWQLLVGGAGPVATLAVATVMPAPGGPAGATAQPLGAGATLWQAGGDAVVVLDGRAREDLILSGLRTRRIDAVDVAVVRTDSRAAATVAATLLRCWPGLTVLVPRSSPLAAAGSPTVSAPRASTVMQGAGLRVSVEPNDGDHLDVTVQPVPREVSR
jgi:competence protein ComEC